MNSQPEHAATALMQRDALMTLLVAQSHGLIQHLALLANQEKTAVAGLMLVSLALGTYTRSPRPDREVIEVYERMMAKCIGRINPLFRSRPLSSVTERTCAVAG